MPRKKEEIRKAKRWAMKERTKESMMCLIFMEEEKTERTNS